MAKKAMNQEAAVVERQAQPAKEKRARALLDIPAMRVKCGEFFTAQASEVDALVKAGVADDRADEKAAKA